MFFRTLSLTLLIDRHSKKITANESDEIKWIYFFENTFTHRGLFLCIQKIYFLYRCTFQNNSSSFFFPPSIFSHIFFAMKTPLVNILDRTRQFFPK